MKNNHKLMLVSLCTAAFALGGCATSQEAGETPDTPVPDPIASGLTETELILGLEEPASAAASAAKKKPKKMGKPEKFLRVENDIEAFLDAMPKDRVYRSNLRDHVEKLRTRHHQSNNRDAVPAMSALSHGYASALLRAAEGRVNNIGQYDGTKKPTIKIHGLITDYYYNPTMRSGYLKVETVTEIFHDNPVKPVRTDTYTWEIDILETGFKEIPVSMDSDGKPYFKVPIDQDQDRIQRKGFNVKLWVGPKFGPNGEAVDDTGDQIRVRRVYLKRINHVNRRNVPDYTQDFRGWLPDDHEVFQVSHANCIDIMFKLTGTQSIPTTYTQLKQFRDDGNYNYCLGRCKNPALINTGE